VTRPYNKNIENKVREVIDRSNEIILTTNEENIIIPAEPM
jgi:hypothetical protein